MPPVESERDTRRTGGRSWGRLRVVGFVLSPMMAMWLWCRFVDPESMIAMIVGVLFTFLFVVIALKRFVEKRANGY
jgi:hypothetical protein